MLSRRSILSLTVLLGLSAVAQAADPKITYEEHIKPIFRAKCFSCHNTDKKTADLDLTSYTTLMIGGASGVVVEAGASADDSYLFNLVNHDAEPFMPPKSEKMAAASIDTIRKWIEGGALENKGSKAMVKKKTNDFALKGAPTGKPDGPAAMPNVLTLQPVTTPKARTAVTALATSPWAPLVAVAGQKQITLYHSQTLQPLGVLPFPEGVPHVLKFSRNGSLLLAAGGRGSYQGKVIVFDVKSGERIMDIGDEVDAVLAADISADQTMVALGGPSKLVKVYSTADGEMLYSIKKHTDWIYSLEFSPDGILLATADRNGGLHVWEAHTGRNYLTLNGHKAAVNSVSFRSDSNILASGSTDQTIKLWEMENGKQVKSWTGHGGGVESVEFARDGRVASCGRDRVTKIWDQNGKQQRAFEAFGDLALRVTHCDETNRMIAGDWTGSIRVWNVADGKRLGELEQNPPSLDARVAAAQAEIKKWSAQVEPRNEAVKTAQASLTAIQTALNKANQDVAKATGTQKSMKPKFDAAKKQVATLKPIVDANTKLAASLKTVVPQLATAVKSANAAAKVLPKDKALVSAAKSLQAQLTSKQAEQKKVGLLLAQKQKLLTTATTQVTAINKQLVDSTALLVAAKKIQAQNTPKLKPAQAALAKVKPAADEANNGLSVAKTDLGRWNEYKALHAELSVLQKHVQELESVEITAAEVEAELQQAKTVVTSAEQAATAITAQMKSGDEKTAQMTTAIKQYQADKVALTAKVTAVNKAIPVLTESLTKAKQAAAVVTNDSEIKAAVNQIQKAIDSQKAQMPVLQKQITDKKAAMDAATKTIAQLAATKTELTKKLTLAKTDIETKKKQIEPVMQKVAAAKKQVEAVTAKVTEAKQVVATRQNKIRPPAPAGNKQASIK